MSDTIKGFRGKDGPILLDYSGVANVPGAVKSIGELTAAVGDHFEVAAVDESGRISEVTAVEKPGGDSGQNPNGGLSTTAANLLIEILRNGVYGTDQSENIAALAAELGVIEPEQPEEPDTPVEPDEPDEPVVPEVTLTSISATYAGGDVAVGTAVTALTGVVVTAHYSDGTSEPVTGYTLSGTIAEGSNTITVSYSGKTATFSVTGVAESGGEDEQPEIPADATRMEYIESTGTQYINTGIPVAWVNCLSMGADIDENCGSKARLFGAEETAALAYLETYRNDTVAKVAWPGKDGNLDMTAVIGDNLTITYDHSRAGYNMKYTKVDTGLSFCELYIGDAEYVSMTLPLFLFASNNNGTAGNFASYKLREFVLYSDDTKETEIIHLIPVRDHDGVVCMYDTVSKQYFRNSGAGDFGGGVVVCAYSTEMATR